MKQTPALWKVMKLEYIAEGFEELNYSIYNNEQEAIAFVKEKTDAHLIAEAPIMLKALEDMLRSHKTDGAVTIGAVHLSRHWELKLEDIIRHAERGQ